MKSLVISAVFAASSLTAGLLQHSAAGSEVQEINAMKAVVNAEVITTAEVDTAVATQIQVWLFENKNNPDLNQEMVNAKVEEFRRKALDDLIDRKLILAEFVKMGGNIKETYVDQAIKDFTRRRFEGDHEKFLTELKKTGMSIRQFREIQRERIIVSALRSQNHGPDTLINTPMELQEVYNEIKGEYASDQRLKLRKISIPKQVGADTNTADSQKRLVEDIRRQLREGQDFATMARTHSTDSDAGNGGLVGNGDIDKNYLSPKLTDIAFGLATGKVSEIIDDDAFWRLLHVDARTGGSVPSFEELKDTCDKLLTSRKRQGYVDRWLASLRHEASIRIF